MDMSHSVHGHILHHIRMLGGKTRGCSGCAHTAPKKRQTVQDISVYDRNYIIIARLCVELKGTHSTLRYYSNSPPYEPTAPCPDGANDHDPHFHIASTVTAKITRREVSVSSCAQTTRLRVTVTVLIDGHLNCCALRTGCSHVVRERAEPGCCDC